MNAELLALMLRTTPMDGAANYRYYMGKYTGLSTTVPTPHQPPQPV